MQKNDFLKYIDSKGQEHNAKAEAVRRVLVFRSSDGKLREEDFPAEAKSGETVVHDGYRVSLSYTPPGANLPVILHAVPHQSHPSKDESNPDLPRIVLHAWKGVGEGHVAPAKDHPIHDHPHDHGKMDDLGQPVAKSRPHHEEMVSQHKTSNASIKHAEFGLPPTERIKNGTTTLASTAEAGQLSNGVHEGEVHHPGNPNTQHYETKCGSCGAAVKKVSFHQGGQIFDPDPIETPSGSHWVLHVCKQEKLKNNAASAVSGQQPHQSWCAKHIGQECDCRPTKIVTKVAPEDVAPAPEIATDKPITDKTVDGPIKVVEGVETAAPEVDVIQQLQNAPPPPAEPAQGEGQPEQAPPTDAA